MYNKIKLDNGVRIVTEKIPYVRSASVGIWVGCGSRFETGPEYGASHFIEHMLFKGTGRRSAADIAEEMDVIGGQMNAFTTKECTCFYGRVLDNNLKKALDLLFDMFFCSSISDEDTIAERDIIFEEIDMYEDTPDDLVTERLTSGIYRDTSLESPVLGTKESLEGMDGEFLRNFKKRHYCPENIVIALSGSFDQSDIDFITEAFSGLEPSGVNEIIPAKYSPFFTVKEKPIEQNHLCIAFPGLPVGDEGRYGMQLLSSILGGGMSSRLFQTVREDHSLCYSIYSFGSGYRDTGMLGIYTALGSDTEEKALTLIMDILDELLQKGVTVSELDRAREQVKSNVIMGLESTSARMNKIGKNELYTGHIPSTEETIEAYDAVRIEAIHSLAKSCLDLSKLSFSAVGQVSEVDRYKSILLR